MGATVKFTNAICDSKNTTWVTFDLCRLRAISRNKTVLSVYTNILYPAYNVHLNFQMQKRANGYKPWLGKHTVDYFETMKPNEKLTLCVIFMGVFFTSTVHMITSVKFTNAICESRNTSWVIVNGCRLRAISRNKTVLNTDISLLYPVHNLHLNFKMQKRANGYKPWLGEYTVDFCAFMRKTNHPVIKIFWNLSKDFTNFDHPCPFEMIATVKWTNVICQSRNTTWVTFDKCRLRAISRNKTVLNIDINVHFPARSITLYWQMQKRENGYKPWLGRYTIDYCAFLRKTNHPVMKIFWDVIKDFINFNHPCPIDGLLIIKDLFWDARNFSLPFPSGDYMLHLTWLFDKRQQYFQKIYFTFHQDLFKD
ncbi:uncharacterized protein Dvir_GJ21067 [Drosophila virilis]|uniref:Uncharacterized protein n=1 Tax=Drosophila virilis TaxID=7244 RepID=B4LN76_DROVI|nr:uncharacterized protein Dvir_GJ21067 [Drosophila virilis]